MRKTDRQGLPCSYFVYGQSLTSTLWNAGVLMPAFHFDLHSEKSCEREDAVYVGVLLELDHDQ